MGVKLAVLACALVAATPVSGGAGFLQTRQLSDGSFAERGQPGYPQLTAWATLGLTAARRAPRARGLTIKYLSTQEAGLTSPTEIALVALAEEALGQNAARLLARLRALQRADGSVGGLVNGTAWSVLAFRGSGTPVQARTTPP